MSDFDYINDAAFSEQLQELLKRTIIYHSEMIKELGENDISNNINNIIVDALELFKQLRDGTVRLDIMKMRINLYLKVDDEGVPLDPLNQKNFSRKTLIRYNPHPSIVNCDLEMMKEYANNNPVTIVSKIPLWFFLNVGDDANLNWLHILALFYYTQVIIINEKSKENKKSTAELTEDEVEFREHMVNVLNNSIDELEEILTKIDDIVELQSQEEIKKTNEFFANNLNEMGKKINEVESVADGIKKMYVDEGIDEKTANSINKVLERVKSEMQNINFEKSNPLKAFAKMAKNISADIKDDLLKDKEVVNNILKASGGALGKMMKEMRGKGAAFPPALEKMLNMFVNNASGGSAQKENSKDVEDALDSLMNNSGLSKDEFYNKVMGKDGEVNFEELEKMMAGMNPRAMQRRARRAAKKGR